MKNALLTQIGLPSHLWPNSRSKVRSNVKPNLRQKQGNKAISIAIIDGAVNSNHPDFVGTDITLIGQSASEQQTSDIQPASCQSPTSPSCQHGTFVAGVIGANSHSPAPGIAPHCKLLVRPVFCEADNLSSCPKVTQEHLAAAINDCVDAGANIVNMSVGLIGPQAKPTAQLARAYQNAQDKGVLLVASSGNQASSDVNSIFKHPWVIPVAAMDEHGNKARHSNGGSWVNQHGLLAPGCNVLSTSGSEGHLKMTGSSVATPFVSGVLGLLWSQHPNATAEQLRRAILQKKNQLNTLSKASTNQGTQPVILNASRSLDTLAQLVTSDAKTKTQPSSKKQETIKMNNNESANMASSSVNDNVSNVVANTAHQSVDTTAVNNSTVLEQAAQQSPKEPAIAPQSLEPTNQDPKNQDQGIKPQVNQCDNCDFIANSPTQYVYAVGRLRPHFPTLGLEKEYEAVARMNNASPRDYHKIFSDSKFNYIAEQVSWIMTIDGQDAYVVLPNSDDELNGFIETLKIDENDTSAEEVYTVAIGLLGPDAPIELRDELPVRMVMCNHVYHFTRTGLLGELSVDNSISTSIRDVFNTLSTKPNMGVSSIDRAKNFVAYRYSSIYTNTLEKDANGGEQGGSGGQGGKSEEDNTRHLAGLDAKLSETSPGRDIVDIIFTYQKNVSGRQNAYYVSVDVTDQFPFLHSNLSDYVATS